MPTFAELKATVQRGVLRDDLTDSYGDYINEALREIQNRYSFVSMKQTIFLTIRPGIIGAGGNVVPANTFWPTGSGTLQFAITGLAEGARYYFEQGNASAISFDGTTPAATSNGYFTAPSGSMYILANASASGQLITAGVITAGIDQVAHLPANFKELQRRQPVHYVSECGEFVPTNVVFEHQEDLRTWVFSGSLIISWPPRVYLERRSSTDSVLGINCPIKDNFNIRVKLFGYLPDLVAGGDTSPIAEAYPRMVIAKAKAIAFSDINDPAEAQFEGEFENKLISAIRQDAYSEVAGRTTHM